MTNFISRPLKTFFKASLLLQLGIFAVACNNGDKKEEVAENHGPGITADKNNADLTLPDGFGALVVADDIGPARHLVVNSEGDIIVKLANAKKDHGIVVLRDTNDDAKVDSISGFGNYGGTGIAMKNGYLYASSNSAVYRYKLDAQELPTNTDNPDTLISGLIDRRQHNSKSIAFDDQGNIYVNIGAYSNSCQKQDRTPGSPGIRPGPILDSAGGIWQFKADQLNQTYGDGIRYATGLRNVVGLDWNKQANKLFVMQHGRDQLHSLFPDLYTEEESAVLPAECMYALEKGDDAGWPYIYYDQRQNKKMLAPEYGGDGKKEGAPDAIDPVVAFPGHLAPDGLLFYTGDMFPEKYKNGAFIAFHGSWNRAPKEQEGFYLAFVPFENGKPSGDWEIFADGFAGEEHVESPGDAKHRPVGLAQGPDGSLYVSDDSGGSIFRIFYNGNTGKNSTSNQE